MRAYTENAQRDSWSILLIRQETQLSRSRLIIVQNKTFLDPFFLYIGWIKPKKPHATVPLMCFYST